MFYYLKRNWNLYQTLIQTIPFQNLKLQINSNIFDPYLITQKLEIGINIFQICI